MQTEPKANVKPRIILPEMTPQCREAAKRLVRQWVEDESGYDEAVWPIIKSALEEDGAFEQPVVRAESKATL